MTRTGQPDDGCGLVEIVLDKPRLITPQQIGRVEQRSIGGGEDEPRSARIGFGFLPANRSNAPPEAMHHGVATGLASASYTSPPNSWNA